MESRRFTYIAENGDIIHEFYTIENISNNLKRDSVDKYVNDVFISTTITEFLDGYKHGYQTINKRNENGTSQNFSNYYENGYLVI
jgi:hypothetical protein